MDHCFPLAYSAVRAATYNFVVQFVLACLCFIGPLAFLFTGKQSEERLPGVREALPSRTDQVGKGDFVLEPATLPTK